MKSYFPLALGAASALLLGIVAVGFAPDAAQAAACAPGDRQLPFSKLCTSQVKSLLPPPSPSFVEGLAAVGCKPVINDGTLAGDFIIYQAAQCAGGPVTLEGGFGAHSGGISVLGGGMNPDFDGSYDFQMYEIATIVSADPKDPTNAMMDWARAKMKEAGVDPAYIKSCRPRREPMFGPDAWVVDDYHLRAAPESQDGPRAACGSYGYDEDNTAYWRIAHGLAIHFNMGQDVYKDIDANSLTVITKGPDGHYHPVKGAMQQEAAEAPSASNNTPPAAASGGNGTVTNIADTPGSAETAYGTTRGWTVLAGTIDGRFRYCVGQNQIDGITLRLGSDGAQWQVAIPTTVASGSFGGFEVDGQRWDMSGPVGANWAFGWINHSEELDAIRNGNLMILDIGRASIDVPLKGTAAVITKVQECLQRRGRSGEPDRPRGVGGFNSCPPA